MSRRPLVSGNWKMNLTHLEAIAVLQKLSYALEERNPLAEVSVHPAFTALRSAQTVIDADDMPIALGAQDVYWEDKGAFTGEVSPVMLAKLDVRYVIVGHSERRQLFGETDEDVNRKVRAVLGAGMTPIMCVGETLEERRAGAAEERVFTQLRAGLAGVGAEQVAKLVIAYEPVWAIGTGHNATPADAQSMAAAIRFALGSDYGEEAAGSVRVQYGGSVSSRNAGELLGQPDVDGALVGGASLDPLELALIAAAARP
jgi:triosephosphate isomerase